MNPPLTFVAFALSRGGDFGGIGLEFYTSNTTAVQKLDIKPGPYFKNKVRRAACQ
jgi:hypothetical protein